LIELNLVQNLSQIVDKSSRDASVNVEIITFEKKLVVFDLFEFRFIIG
jgi:hypothetical protein